MRRHIIVEGMDGTGKDTLIRRLRIIFQGLELHARASTSLGGPVANVAAWTEHDVATMPEQPPSIYNRHPLVSEPIYRDLRTAKSAPDEGAACWLSRSWVASHRRIAADNCILVMCQPPFEVVQANLDRTPDDHMPGVVENASVLYARYAGLLWPGVVIRYDYTRSDPYALANSIQSYLGK